MLQKQSLIQSLITSIAIGLIALTMVTFFSCDRSVTQSELLQELQKTIAVKKYTQADIVGSHYDELISKELKKQQNLDSNKYIIKVAIYDKDLYAFPIKKSSRLDIHINDRDNEDDVANSLQEHFDDFYDCRFNKELGISKFYFGKTLSNPDLTKFLDMCILKNYEIVELK